LILDGGAARVGVESTVLSLVGDRPRLLRPGGTPLEAIEAEVGPVAVDAPGTSGAAGGATGGDGPVPSPGMSTAHYAPSVPLVLVGPGASVAARPGERLGLLAASDRDREAAIAGGGPYAAEEVPSPTGDALELAAGLFEALHRLDAAGVDRIVAHEVPEEGPGRAIMDRLRRAAAARPAAADRSPRVAQGSR
jgi:L-threonylcarbamoyladenylate synthase